MEVSVWGFQFNSGEKISQMKKYSEHEFVCRVRGKKFSELKLVTELF